VAKRKVQAPPTAPSPNHTPSILELDRFSRADLHKWSQASKDLDQLHSELYFGVEPERQRYREEIREALRSSNAGPFAFQRWARIVRYRYSDQPLSSAGSLTGPGGRFNIGCEVNAASRPFPALYLAENQETAYREFFQIENDLSFHGLTSEELALTNSSSVSIVYVNGHLEQVFDATDQRALAKVAKVFAKIKQPQRVKDFARRLGMRPRGGFMIRTVAHLNWAITSNWRAWPIQFEMPSPSQIFGQLLLDAGFEGVRYSSTKHSGRMCLAVFPSNLASDRTVVELADRPPAVVAHQRLDLSSCEALCGWDVVRPSQRP
jgi:RES domain-containing protein